MEKKWKIKGEGDKEIVQNLAKELNINSILAKLLVQRGISTFELAHKFFRPSLADLHNPFEMKDMDKAIGRIEKAIENNEKILIYGDYDVDGTTAVALVYSFLTNTFPNYTGFDFYIPDRYKEGYGISYIGIDFAYVNNFKLVIALDCGIKANEQVEYATKRGIDFIICDHHRPGDNLPDAIAVLDPKRLDCSYQEKELSGCGVGFKLIQGFSIKKNIPFEELHKYLDLVVISIASDIVPITGENRVLAYFGLKLINSNPRNGIVAMLALANIKKIKESIPSPLINDNLVFNRELNINDLVFVVGPRLNAAGRIENGKASVELLIADTSIQALDMAESVNITNNERRSLDATTTQQALQMIKDDESFKQKKSTVIFHPDWHKGVVGIVASRLTEIYYRPTIVFTQSNDLITGSARSIKDFDIYDAIDSCRDLLEHFGGHKYAAGLSLIPERLNDFIERFECVVSSSITDEMLVPEIEIDSEIELTDITSKFYKILRQFAPFGPGNMSPVFITNNVVDKGFAKVVGEKHLKLTITYPGYSIVEFGAIAFQQADCLDIIQKKKPFRICYHIEENEWNGNTYLQLNIKDIKF